MTDTTEPTVSFRELLAANPDAVTDDTEILITAGELRARLDELGRLREQADEDAALVGWYLYNNSPHSVRTAVLSNRFGARAQVVLDARLAKLPDGQPCDRAAQLALLRGTDATAQLQAWLDGTAILSKAAVRTVLWDLAEVQTELADAYEIIGTHADGSPHIIEVTVGLDPFSPDAIHHTVHHPIQCHRLPYGEYCTFDAVVQERRLAFPADPGRYEARIEECDNPAYTELLLERMDNEPDVDVEAWMRDQVSGR